MGKLTTKQEQAVEMILEFKRDIEIARVLKVKPSTVSNWKKIPEFKAAIDKGLAHIYAGESTLKAEIRMKAWAKLIYLIDLGSTKAVLKALDLTEPDKNVTIEEFSVRFGPPIAKKLATHLQNMVDPTEGDDDTDEKDIIEVKNDATA